jgi:hypothetical protein
MGNLGIIHGVEKDVYATSVSPVYPLGQKMITPDGSIFRWSEKSGVAGVANKLQQSSAPVANWSTQAHTVALVVGDTTITFHDGGTAFTVNQLRGGTITVEETDDLGHIYRVKSNLVTAAQETVCTLEDGVTVQVAMVVAANNVLTATLNPWKEFIIHPSPPTAFCIGVPRVIIGASAFGWVQTRGVASCLIDSGAPALLIGNEARPSETVNGSVALREESAGVTDLQDVGVALETAPDGDFGTLFLKIE